VNNFASELSNRIKTHPAFWADIQTVYSEGFRSLVEETHFNATNEAPNTSDAINRLIEVAYTLSQTGSEGDKNLAQGIALYSALAARKSQTTRIASDILISLGNFPGADQLRAQLKGDKEDKGEEGEEGEAPNLLDDVRDYLLRSFNLIKVDNRAYHLTDFQKNVWLNLNEKISSAISAPTSAGKSFVVLEHLYKEVLSANKFNSVFIAPTRALLGEVYTKISAKLEPYSSSIRISTIPTLDSEQRPKQIFVLTQERLQVLLATSELRFDLIIVDEAQSIADESRGMILQDCLESIRSRNTSTRFLFLAPGATGFKSLEAAIGIEGIKVEKTDLSPVVQNRVVVQNDAADPFKLHLSLLNEAQKIELGSYVANRGFENSKTRLAAVALELGRNGGSLVYGTGPADAEKVAGQIASGRSDLSNPSLIELSKFIKQHVHKRYSLADHVLRTYP
jgi:hypothetical protein